jgi:hypothetical protein
VRFETQMALLIFILALVIRVLFLLATADSNGPISPYYMGDTAVWLGYASAILSCSEFNLGLPLRPPGVAYLVALLWDGQSASYLFLKLAWAVMGAASVAILYLAILRSFGFKPAIIASLIIAASTGLIIASTALNNETPYLLLLSLNLLLWKPILKQPSWQNLLLWSLLNALACLIRVEHVLIFALSSVWLCWSWAHNSREPTSWQRGVRRSLFIVAIFVLILLPWQLYIWSQIARFNNEPLSLGKQTEQAYLNLERGLSVMDWTDKAQLERESLPAFARRPLSNFVATTVAIRGGLVVHGSDFKIIEDAFGYSPQAINPYPFISIYGGLNFYLANNPTASGGFSLAALDHPPPLQGGGRNYPTFLISGLPPAQLTLTYPPHLEIVNHGYALGWQWIRNHPADMLSLVGQKMSLFWSGVTMGLTGYNLPLGLSGTRGAVDMVVPDITLGVTFWRGAGFFILLGGLWVGRRNKALIPWLMILGTKVITTLLFYGYAREGLVVIPVFALLLALLVCKLLPAGSPSTDLPDSTATRTWLYGVLILSLTLVAIEGTRWSSRPAIHLDGVEVGVMALFPASDNQQHHLTID